jgi:Fe-S-cluster-containing hydrogenase component 2
LPRLKVNKKVCVGCLVCELVCSFKQTEEYNLKRSGIRILPEGMFPGEAQVCHQCVPAPCLEVCPAEAILHRGEFVDLDRGKCSGCGLCVEACPYAAITLDPQDGLARKCNLCGGSPECIAFCPKDAISIEESSNKSISKAQT